MNLCPRCQFDGKLCLCRDIPRVETRTAFVIVRHANEARRRSNSGRIAALALPRCEVLDRRDRRDGAEFKPPAGAWLLFPGGGVLPADEPPPGVVVVLDGTWREAKRMFTQNPALCGLPRLSLPAPPATPRLRRPPAHGMATLESMAHAVEALEGIDKARPLHELFALFVARSRTAARRAGKWLLQ